MVIFNFGLTLAYEEKKEFENRQRLLVFSVLYNSSAAKFHSFNLVAKALRTILAIKLHMSFFGPLKILSQDPMILLNMYESVGA